MCAQVGQGSFSRVRLAHVRAAKRTLSPREVLEGEEAPDDVPFALKIMRKFDICVQKQVARRLFSISVTVTVQKVVIIFVRVAQSRATGLQTMACKPICCRSSTS